MLDNKFLKKFNLSKYIVIFSTKLLFKKKTSFECAKTVTNLQLAYV